MPESYRAGGMRNHLKGPLDSESGVSLLDATMGVISPKIVFLLCFPQDL